MIAVRLVFFAQLLVMLSAFAIFVVTPIDFHTLALMFYLVSIAAAAMVFALWQFVRHRSRRDWALATVATPILCLTTPFLIARLNGGPLHPAVLIVVLVATVVGALLVLLARSEQWKGEGVFASKRLNVWFLTVLGALLTLTWIPFAYGLFNQGSVSLPRNIGERDWIIRLGGIYFASVAGPALVLSVFAMLFAPIGVVRNPGSRIVHIGQLLLALLTFVSLAIGAFAAWIAMVYPG